MLRTGGKMSSWVTRQQQKGVERKNVIVEKAGWGGGLGGEARKSKREGGVDGGKEGWEMGGEEGRITTGDGKGGKG